MTKYLSETIKKGEPEDHRLAVEKVVYFLNENKFDRDWQIRDGYEVQYPIEMVKQLNKYRVHLYHTFDIGILAPILDMSQIEPFKANIPKYVPIAVIEMMGNIGFYYRSTNGKIKKANPTKHSKAKQIQNDKVNRNMIEKHFHGTRYITLLKEEVLGDCGHDGKQDTHYTISYLSEHVELLAFLK